MTEAVLLSGKRGAGKSITACRLMADYVRQGRPVATNMDIRLDKMARPWSRLVCWRLPDHPTAADFELLPPGNPNPVDEGRNGLIVLDEVGTFLNSRDWQAKDRKSLISWLLHSRKFGWDLILIAQHPRLVDAQIRDALCDVHASAKRADKLTVPVIGAAAKFITGKPLKLPRAHVVTFRYGFLPQAPVMHVLWFSGTEYGAMYDSLQKISAEGQQGVSSYLPAWHLKGRHMKKIEMYRGVALSAFVLGVMVGVLGGFMASWLSGGDPAPAAAVQSERIDASVHVNGVISSASGIAVSLSDGRVAPVEASRFDPSGVLYQVGGVWFRERK